MFSFYVKSVNEASRVINRKIWRYPKVLGSHNVSPDPKIENMNVGAAENSYFPWVVCEKGTS